MNRLDLSYSVEPKEDEDLVIKTLLWICVGIPIGIAVGIGIGLAAFFIHLYLR